MSVEHLLFRKKPWLTYHRHVVFYICRKLFIIPCDNKFQIYLLKWSLFIGSIIVAILKETWPRVSKNQPLDVIKIRDYLSLLYGFSFQLLLPSPWFLWRHMADFWDTLSSYYYLNVSQINRYWKFWLFLEWNFCFFLIFIFFSAMEFTNRWS